MTALAARSSDNSHAEEKRDNGRGPERDRLADIIFERSFGRGRIILSSGKESHFYFDMKPSMLDSEGAHLITKNIIREVRSVRGEFVGGLEMGAVPITGAVCQLSYQEPPPIRGFFVRKQAKAHGAKKVVEGLAKGEKFEGRRVVIVDDVTTSGESALNAVEACQRDGAEIVLVISIVDREEGATELFAERGLPFKALFSASEFLRK